MMTPLPFPKGGASDGAPPPGPATPLPTGTAVAHLVIDRVLHQGPHAVVYLAHDGMAEGLAGVVALMEYFPLSLALRHPDGSVRARQAGDAIALSVGREAFVQDANALERIAHPNVLRVLGSLQANRTVYRAMAFVDGPTLESHVQSRTGPVQVGEIVRLLDALLDGLEALHAAGLVHGNVRPDQIMLSGGRIDRPVLLGMGSAAAEIAGHYAGPWAAPEQSAASRHDRINSATDLYMLACTAWFAANGAVPPTLRDRLARPDDWKPAAGLAALIEGPEDAPGDKALLVRTLLAALALLPSARPQHVADMRGLLHPSTARRGFESSGAAPLWVGPIPDRESQWEVVEMAARGARVVSPRPPSPSLSPSPSPYVARGRDAQANAQARAKSTEAPVDAPSDVPDRPRQPAGARPRTSRPAVIDEPSELAQPVRWPFASRWPLIAGSAAGLALAVGASFVLRPAVPRVPAGVPMGVAAPAPDTVAEPAAAADTSRMGLPSVPQPLPGRVPPPSAAAAPLPAAVNNQGVPVPRASRDTVPRRNTPPPTSPGAPALDSVSRPVVRAAPKPLCAGATGFELAYCLQVECAKAANRSLALCVGAAR